MATLTYGLLFLSKDFEKVILWRTLGCFRRGIDDSRNYQVPGEAPAQADIAIISTR